MLALRAAFALITGLLYQIATNPFVQAFLLAIAGHWRIALYWLAAWFALNLVAVAFQVRRNSTLPGLEDTEIVTAPDWLFVLGDEQQGWLPQWLIDKWPGWVPYWFIAFSCSVWRNKLRNLPFVKALAWLHKPKGQLVTRVTTIGPVLIRVRTRGWMAELEYVFKRRFGDFGPRLDQPDQWGGVSWAFRPAGRF